MQKRVRKPRVLVADTPMAMRELQEALGAQFDFMRAETHEEAMRALREGRPKLVVIGYHFDQMRPYRLIKSIRNEVPSDGTPIVLLQLLPLQMGRTTELQVSESYEALGVQRFLTLPHGLDGSARKEALENVRGILLSLLR